MTLLKIVTFNGAIPACSGHSKQTKVDFVQSEALRIRLRCSRQSYAWVHLERFRHRLLKNGYPRWFIAKHFSKALSRFQGIQRAVAQGQREMYRSRTDRRAAQQERYGPPGPTTWWIPRLSDKFLESCKRSLRRRGAEVQVRERAGELLKHKLTASDMMVRTLTNDAAGLRVSAAFPEQSDKTFWYSKNQVYHVRCAICDERYTGESKQWLVSRMDQHIKHALNPPDNPDVEVSALSTHHHEQHGGQQCRFEILQRFPCRGYMQRKMCEAVVAQILPSSLNRRAEGGGLVGCGNLYLPAHVDLAQFVPAAPANAPAAQLG